MGRKASKPAAQRDEVDIILGEHRDYERSRDAASKVRRALNELCSAADDLSHVVGAAADQIALLNTISGVRVRSSALDARETAAWELVNRNRSQRRRAIRKRS